MDSSPRRVLVYADFRSPHARGMLAGLKAAGNDVLALSSEVVDLPGVVSPVDSLTRARSQGTVHRHDTGNSARTRLARRLSDLQVAHTLLNLARLPARVRALKSAVASFRPDVVHALRLPYEGLTALTAVRDIPVVVSTWGLDFEPMASRDLLMRLWLRLTLRRARGIHTDNPADHGRALAFGLRSDAPHLYAAGNFGLDSSLFHDGDEKEPGLVVYARRAVAGINYRGFVAAALALDPRLNVRAVGVGLAEARDELVAEFGDAALARVELTERLDRDAFAALIRRADVVVSPAFWDGTPNTVIEAYYCGARLVVGRLPQFELLVEQGMDMTLVDPADSSEMQHAIEGYLSGAIDSDAERSLPVEFDRIANEERFERFYNSVLGVTD
jgi:glycosyltransferase involved in cell wall biosynthesis